ncbi:hypothetical protein CH275_16485 [Rhodococcus sp. 06-235-1A]|nr:hypothetical protein CH275_16485 [Rhodococcus sp. 06-235-1A]
MSGSCGGLPDSCTIDAMPTANEIKAVDSDALAFVLTRYRREISQFHAEFLDETGIMQINNFPEWIPPRFIVKSLVDKYLNVSIIGSLSVIEIQPPDSCQIIEFHLSVGAHHRLLNSQSRVPEMDALAWAAAIFGPWAEESYFVGPEVVTAAGLSQVLGFSLYISDKGLPCHPPQLVALHRLLQIVGKKAT